MLKSTVKTSVPTARRVCGYEIKKLPLGKYLQAAERLPALFEEVMGACFPGASVGDAFEQLKQVTDDRLSVLIANALAVAPQKVLEVVSDLSGIPYDTLLNDERIGIAGIVEILQAMWEVNDLKNVLAAVKRALAGYKGLSPQV